MITLDRIIHILEYHEYNDVDIVTYFRLINYIDVMTNNGGQIRIQQNASIFKPFISYTVNLFVPDNIKAIQSWTISDKSNAHYFDMIECIYYALLQEATDDKNDMYSKYF